MLATCSPIFHLNVPPVSVYSLDSEKHNIHCFTLSIFFVVYRYVPMGPDGPESILVGGDRLTEGNSRSILWAFAEGGTPDHRLDGLVCKFEDWHAIRNLFEVSEFVRTQPYTSRKTVPLNKPHIISARYCTFSPPIIDP